MRIFLMCALIASGLVLIVKGGDLFVTASTWMARVLRVSEVVIGATIVSIGTTLPEFFSSITAAIKGLGGDGGYNALALSNAMGSMLANSGLILAIVMTVRPPQCDRKIFLHNAIYVLLISVLLAIFMMTDASISRGESIALLAIFIVYMVDSIMRAKADRCSALAPPVSDALESRVRMIVSFFVGGACILGGAVLLVTNARNLALDIGVSTELVGVTIVALGTSLPELVTALASLRHGTGGIGVGNIMGAHVINATLIVGLVGMISGGIAVEPMTRNVTSLVLVAVMAIMTLPPLITGKFRRWQGVTMLLVYLAYIVYNIFFAIST